MLYLGRRQLEDTSLQTIVCSVNCSVQDPFKLGSDCNHWYLSPEFVSPFRAPLVYLSFPI